MAEPTMDDRLIVGQRHRDAAADLRIAYSGSAASASAALYRSGELDGSSFPQAFARFERDNMPAATPTPVSAAVEERAREDDRMTAPEMAVSQALQKLFPKWEADQRDCIAITLATAALTNAQPIRAGVREATNPCSKIFDHKWLDPECVETGCQSLRGRHLMERLHEVVHHDAECKAIGGNGDGDCTCDAVPLLRELEKVWHLPVGTAALATPDDALTERASVIEECALVAESAWASHETPEQWTNPNLLCEHIATAIRTLLTRAPGQGEGK